MQRSSPVTEMTDAWRYDYSKGKRVLLKNCEIVLNFLFDKTDFYLLKKGGTFIISTPCDGELVLLAKFAVKEDGYEKPPSEAVAEFRKGYLKNKITRERIDFFIKDPVKYSEMYKKGRA